MPKPHKLLLGVACLAVGGALLTYNGAAMWFSLTHAGGGVPLGNAFGLAAGLGIGGASLDLLGKPRPPAPEKPDIAKSIWATRAHVDHYDIGEK
jgi:hypothetical protein